MFEQSSEDFTLNVFTLNCWGIPVVSKNRKERFEAIARYLVQSPHTIVCLQEVWSEKDFLFLRDKLKDKLPYSHYFYSGVLGSGLCVFSKWLIQDIFYHQWPLNGYIHKIHHGDWFGGKGVGLCRIRCGKRLINVYCTHLHAEYHADDIYLAHRVLQAHSTAEFIHLTSSPADVSILAGDLNTGPGNLSYNIITQLPSLLDPFDMVCVGSNPLVKKQSGTCDNSNNSYSDRQLAKTSPDGKRIDHILFSVNPLWDPSVICFGNPLEDRVPGQPFSYSDHNAVTLELRLRPAVTKKPALSLRQISKDEAFDDTITQAIKVCEDAYTDISKTKKLFLIAGGLILMLLIGTVGFWPNYFISNVVKIVLTGLCFYCLIMGSLWNKIELNSLKAGLNALENFNRTRNELKAEKKDKLTEF